MQVADDEDDSNSDVNGGAGGGSGGSGDGDVVEEARSSWRRSAGDCDEVDSGIDGSVLYCI